MGCNCVDKCGDDTCPCLSLAGLDVVIGGGGGSKKGGVSG